MISFIKCLAAVLADYELQTYMKRKLTAAKTNVALRVIYPGVCN